jgi:hypothetical protein
LRFSLFVEDDADADDAVSERGAVTVDARDMGVHVPESTGVCGLEDDDAVVQTGVDGWPMRRRLRAGATVLHQDGDIILVSRTGIGMGRWRPALRGTTKARIQM